MSSMLNKGDKLAVILSRRGVTGWSRFKTHNFSLLSTSGASSLLFRQPQLSSPSPFSLPKRRSSFKKGVFQEEFYEVENEELECDAPSELSFPTNTSLLLAQREDQTTTVQEKRTVALRRKEKGNEHNDEQFAFEIADLPTKLQTSGLHVSSLTDPKLRVVEQRVIQPTNRLVGRTVSVRRNEKESIVGTLVGALQDGTLLIQHQNEDKVSLCKNPESITVEDVSDVPNMTFSASPVLRGNALTSQEGPHDINLLYPTTGFNWSAAYTVLLLSENEARLSGSCNISNSTGKSFQGAAVTLLSEETAIAEFASKYTHCTSSWAKFKGHAERFSHQRPIAYIVPRPLSLPDGQTTQVPLLNASRYAKPLLRRQHFPEEQTPIQKVIKLQTNISSSSSSSPASLPFGVVSILQQNAAMPPLSSASDIYLPLHEPYPHIVGRREQLHFELDDEDEDCNRLTEKISIKLTNKSMAKEEEVVVEEAMYRWNKFRVENMSHPPAVRGDEENPTFVWKIKVKPASTEELVYTVTYVGLPAKANSYANSSISKKVVRKGRSILWALFVLFV
ncbi:hypothetical protein QOT17_005116 [Balamuthia mandrillaris]